MVDRLLFKGCLLAWRGVQTATPLYLTQIFSDRDFNAFAATFGLIQLIAGIVGFGQSQFSYTRVNDVQRAGRVTAVDANTLVVISCVALLLVVLLGVPNPLSAVNASANALWFRGALIVSAIGLSMVDLLAAHSLVDGRLARAAGIYAVATSGYLLAMAPVFFFSNPRLVLLLAVPGVFAAVYVVIRTEWLRISIPSLRERLKFGSVQTLILLFSGAIPTLFHIALPSLNLNLKGSKFISIFMSLSGVAMFVASSAVVAQSRDISAQNSLVAGRSANKFTVRVALFYLPLVAVAFLAERLLLGASAVVFSICCWLFLVSQLTINYCRYICFAQKALRLDLLANVVPVGVLVCILLVVLRLRAIQLEAELPVLVITAMSLMSAGIYLTSVNMGLMFRKERT